MHLLPTNLGRLAEHAKDHGGRFALDNVRLKVNTDNTFIAEATNTKVLVRVSGPCVALSDEFPDLVPGLATAPNGKSEAMVPASAWKKTFTTAKKLTAKRGLVACLRSVAVKIGDRVTTFGATDTTSHQCESVENGAGRFPPTDDILGRDKKRADSPTRFAVDPLMLADLLKTVAEAACDAETMRVEFEVWDNNRPIHVRAQRPDGIAAHAVIMPLAGDCDEPESEQEEKVPADVAALERDVNHWKIKSNTLEHEVEKWTTKALDSGEKAERFRLENMRLREVLAEKEKQIAELLHGRQPMQPPATRPLTRAERLAAIKA